MATTITLRRNSQVSLRQNVDGPSIEHHISVGILGRHYMETHYLEGIQMEPLSNEYI